MSDKDEVIEWLSGMERDRDYRNRRPARTGRIVDGAIDPNPTNGAPTGWLWVREGEDGERSETLALIVGIRDDVADAPVEIGENSSGALCAIRPYITERTIYAAGGNLPALGVPRQPPSMDTQITQTVSLTAGHIRPSIANPGSMEVYIEPFWYNGIRRGDIDNIDIGIANVPTGLDEMRWAIVAFDPVANDYNVRLGAIAIYNNPNFMPIVDNSVGLTSVVIPAGEIPLAPPLILVSGQTAITPANIQYSASRFEDTRHWLGARGTLLSEVAQTVTIASGVATLGNGSNFVLAAETGTADTVTSFVVSGVPRLLLLTADTGDTITIENGTAVDFVSGRSYVQSGTMGLMLFWDGSAVIDIGTPTGATVVRSNANVTTPTEAELISAFGAIADFPLTAVGILNDNGAGANEWIVWSDGTDYWYAAGTKAT